MGLFSKKTVVCERCGKQYEVRVAMGRHICDECQQVLAQKQREVAGYYEMASWFKYTLSEQEMDQIPAHRAAILEKYRNPDGVNRMELMQAADNYKQLSDDQARSLIRRALDSMMSTTIGAAYTDNFFVLTNFEKVVVDAADVFAVGYTSDYNLNAGTSEVILCAVFTNDPFVPVFPMVFLGKTGMFELLKSKKGRAGTAEFFAEMCPNLRYPVGDLKQLKKIIKSEGRVNGNIDPQFMLERISDAGISFGIFDTKSLHSDLLPETANMMESYGYLEDNVVNAALKMDKMLTRKYWTKVIESM